LRPFDLIVIEASENSPISWRFDCVWLIVIEASENSLISWRVWLQCIYTARFV